MAISISKVEHGMKLVKTYSAERCYSAADRQVRILLEYLVSQLAKEKNLDEQTFSRYQKVARLLDGL